MEVKGRLRGSPWHGHLGESDSALLSSRQAGHWPGGQLPRDAITPQLVAVLLLITSCKQQNTVSGQLETQGDGRQGDGRQGDWEVYLGTC